MLFVTLPAAAHAQPREPFVSIRGGMQAGGTSLGDRFEFEQHQETATVDVGYPSKEALLVDVGGGFRLWRRIGLGVVVTNVTAKSAARIDAAIPHPFQFGRLRPISGSHAGAERRETAVHVQLRYPLRLATRLRIAVSAGPSFFNGEQELVTRVQFDEAFPYDEAAFRSADTSRASGSAAGFNAGADAVWPLGRRFGVGGTIRFVRGTVDLDAPGSRRVGIDVGGVQGGVGLTLWF